MTDLPPGWTYDVMPNRWRTVCLVAGWVAVIGFLGSLVLGALVYGDAAEHRDACDAGYAVNCSPAASAESGAIILWAIAAGAAAWAILFFVAA